MATNPASNKLQNSVHTGFVGHSNMAGFLSNAGNGVQNIGLGNMAGFLNNTGSGVQNTQNINTYFNLPGPSNQNPAGDPMKTGANQMGGNMNTNFADMAGPGFTNLHQQASAPTAFCDICFDTRTREHIITHHIEYNEPRMSRIWISDIRNFEQIRGTNLPWSYSPMKTFILQTDKFDAEFFKWLQNSVWPKLLGLQAKIQATNQMWNGKPMWVVQERPDVVYVAMMLFFGISDAHFYLKKEGDVSIPQIEGGTPQLLYGLGRHFLDSSHNKWSDLIVCWHKRLSVANMKEIPQANQQMMQSGPAVTILTPGQTKPMLETPTSSFPSAPMTPVKKLPIPAVPITPKGLAKAKTSLAANPRKRKQSPKPKMSKKQIKLGEQVKSKSQPTQAEAVPAEQDGDGKVIDQAFRDALEEGILSEHWMIPSEFESGGSQ